MGIGVWELGLILMIVMLLFGTQRLRTVGGDLGTAIRGFKTALREEEAATPASKVSHEQES